MNNAPATTTAATPAPAQLMQSIEKYLESMGNKLTPKHRTQFIEIATAFQLNPFIREIYGIPYGDNFNIIVGYEVYLKRAEASGQLAGWRAWTEGDGNNLKGCVEIVRKDWNAPFYHEVYIEEYDQKNSMWKSKPRTMIKKVAIAQGFRMAFPVELGGIPYTADELPDHTQPQPTQQHTSSKPQSAPPKERSQAQQQQQADNGDKATEGQIKMLFVKLKQAGVSEASFKAHYKIEHMADMPKAIVNEAIKAIGEGKIAEVVDAEPQKAAERCIECGGEINAGFCMNKDCIGYRDPAEM